MSKVDLTSGIVAILHKDGYINGTGFAVGERLILTCAHVVEKAGYGPGDTLVVRFHGTEDNRDAQVLAQYWRSPDDLDIAVLNLIDAVPGVEILPLGASKASYDHYFLSFGYPNLSYIQGAEARGVISRGDSRKDGRYPLLQLVYNPIDAGIRLEEGFSGAPIWDDELCQVVGMVCDVRYKITGTSDMAFAIPSETFCELCEDLGVHLIGRPGELHSVPREPDLYILPKEAYRNVKQVLMTNTGSNQVAIQGMTGVGKSVLASVLANDEQVRRKFPDGVSWHRLGPNPDLPARQAQIAEAIGEKGRFFQDTQHGRFILESLLKSKTCLIVLDDVWINSDKRIDAQPSYAFNCLGPNSKLLITTQDEKVAAAFDAEVFHLSPMGNRQALELLARCADQPVDNLPASAQEVVQKCGGVPLALSVIGTAAKTGDVRYWNKVLSHLKTAALEKIESYSGNYQYTDLLFPIKIGVGSLPAKLRQKYFALAIFHPSAWVPPSVLSKLWEQDKLPYEEIEDILTIFTQRALLIRDQRGYFRLHDLFYNYLCRFAENSTEQHNALLKGYASV